MAAHIEHQPTPHLVSRRKKFAAAATLALVVLTGAGCKNNESSKPDRPAEKPAAVAKAKLTPFGKLLAGRMWSVDPDKKGIRFASGSTEFDRNHLTDELLGKISPVESRQRKAIANCAVAAYNLGAVQGERAQEEAANFMDFAQKAYTKGVADKNRDSGNFAKAGAFCTDATNTNVDKWEIPAGPA